MRSTPESRTATVHPWQDAGAYYLQDPSAMGVVPVLDPRPGMRVLDVGCGPGSLTADLARRVAPGAVIGVDRVESVLDEARAATNDLANVRFTVGDVYDLPFAGRTFDVVHAHQVLQHLSDPVAALVEMRRVCRPDGVVAVRDSDYAAFTWDPPDPDLARSVAR